MNIPKLIIWSIVLVVLVILLIELLIFKDGTIRFFVFDMFKEYKIVYEKEFDDSNIDNIDVNWRSGEINVHSYNGETIKVMQRSKRDLKDTQVVQVATNNNTLNIKEGRPIIYFLSFYTGSNIVDVYLPEKQYNDINLKCSSGKIEIEKIECNNFTGKVSSGKIKISNLITENADLDITSGKLDIDNIKANRLETKISSGNTNVKGTIKNVKLKCTSGKINFEDNILPDSLEANTSSGNINISIPENDGFEVEYKVTSGKFDTKFDLYTNISSGSKSGKGKYKDGGNLFNFKVTSGKIYLDKR